MKITLTEQQMQDFADMLEDVFFAGRIDESNRDSSKDWRRVALCAIMEIGEMSREQEQPTGEHICAKCQKTIPLNSGCCDAGDFYHGSCCPMCNPEGKVVS